VSPWQPNGTAIKYVQQNPYCDHKKIVSIVVFEFSSNTHVRTAQILGIARGLRVLHTMSPVILHGDLRGDSIQIATDGRPLLADFGLAKVRIHRKSSVPRLGISRFRGQMVEDMNGAMYTQSKGVSDTCRFTAPELLMGENPMTTGSDIWSFGMTALQVYKHHSGIIVNQV
jgi:serine/threonine protein kinase